MQGSLFIITAASGTGKTSLVEQLIATTDNLAVSISHTTRPPRPKEIDGQHYYFTDKETFLTRVAAGEFLEHAEVFGNYYGTSHVSVSTQLDAGLDVILEIDWQGALQVKKLFKDVSMIFILPPSLQALRQRLSNRGQDSIKVINTRMAAAIDDMRQYHYFDYLVFNDNFEVAASELRSIIIAKRQTIERQQASKMALLTEMLN